MHISGIPPHDLLLLLLQITLLLGLARLLGLLAGRAGLPPVAGELLAGVVAGPSLIGALLPEPHRWLFPSHPAQFHMLDAVAQLGALLLVGLAGLDVDPRSIAGHRRTIAAVSLGGLLLPVAAGAAVTLVLPDALRAGGSGSGLFALFIGTAVGITSIPVVAKILAEMGLVGHRTGQVILAAATVNDVAAWLLLSLVSAMAHRGSGAHEPLFAALSLACVIFATAAAVRLLGRRRPVARPAARTGRPAPPAGAPPERSHGPGEPSGTTVAMVTVAVLGGAAVTEALGLEPVLGAFSAGIVLRAVPRLDARRLGGLRVTVFAVLAPLYLATAGLRVDLTVFGDPAVFATLAAVLAVAMGAKLAGTYAGARIGRLGRWEAATVAAGMNARGVVGIIAADVGARLGLLTDAMYAVIVTVAIATSVVTPPLLAWSLRRCAPALPLPDARPEPAATRPR